MLELSFSTILDFLIIGFLGWRVAWMIRGTRAMSIFIGLIVLAFTFLLSTILKLNFTHKALSYFFDHLILIVIILFQEEIRRTLADVGRRANLFTNRKSQSMKDIAEAVARVSTQMAKEQIGGLIVIEREDKLKNIMDTGSEINARVKPEVIYSFFLPGSPIHDGAIIISNGEIAAAGCLLPLSKDTNLNKRYGTRHRAAIGLTEETDALVILISEEMGIVNLVKNGKINSNLSENEIKQALLLLQDKSSEEPVKETFLKKLFKRS